MTEVRSGEVVECLGSGRHSILNIIIVQTQGLHGSLLRHCCRGLGVKQSTKLVKSRQSNSFKYHLSLLVSSVCLLTTLSQVNSFCVFFCSIRMIFSIFSLSCSSVLPRLLPAPAPGPGLSLLWRLLSEACRSKWVAIVDTRLCWDLLLLLASASSESRNKVFSF